MRVIISGVTGAIGIALINECIKSNIETLVFSRQASLRSSCIPSHPLVKVKDCALDELVMMQNEEGRDYDAFFHLAWDGTNGSKRNDFYLQNLNVKYALDAVGAANRFGCHTFIGAGSQAEYGRVDGVLTSYTPTFPETGYGIAKLCAGQMTREYAHALGIKHIWARILSVYGPNDGSQSMVMSTIYKLKYNITPQFTKGEQMWDYLYSGDAAEALLSLCNGGKDGKTYVLGSGIARPLMEYIRDIRDLVAPDMELVLGEIPYADNQVMCLCADISELTKDTGFEPKTSFKNGINSIIAWINTKSDSECMK